MKDISTTISTLLFLRISTRTGRKGITCMSLLVLLSALLFMGSGCTMASKYRKRADKTAEKIINKKQTELFGQTKDFNIERPGDILRRRLLIEQDLPQTGKASLGADNLDKIAHWPEKAYPVSKNSGAAQDGITLEKGRSLKLSLIQALEVGALNSADYQTKKESVFQSALDLNLQRNEFGFFIDGEAGSQLTVDTTAGETVKGVTNTGSLSVSKTLKSGAKIITAIGVDVVSLLTGSKTSSMGITGDASISIPLLRGAGRYIAAEPLTQAEQNLVYALYDLERYKKTFAVDVVTSYLSVLQQSDQVDNAAENYRNLITSTRRTQRLADAGRATVIEVNQSLQEELTARARWISATKMHENQLDSFKTLIGLPADADITLDRAELERLNSQYAAMAKAVETPSNDTTSKSTDLVPPSMEGAGVLEMNEDKAIELAFGNRVDLKVAQGRVYDAQRAVVVKANALKAELTLLGTAQVGQVRSLATTDLPDASLDTSSGVFNGLLNLNLPVERTAERNEYRKSYIALEQAVRNVQSLEDTIKLSIRQSLNKMVEARESVAIQTKAVSVAENRAKSTSMFFEAGRSELRDLLEAQASLLTARNALTTAVVEYRRAELAFQRDAGILQIDDKGLMVEYSPTGE